MPASLSAEAAAEWKRITRLLQAAGIVAHLDRAALAMYCQAWQRWTEAEATLAESGTVVKSPNGFPILSPFLSVSNQVAKQMQILLSEFGLSPAARHRLLGATEKKPSSEPTRLSCLAFTKRRPRQTGMTKRFGPLKLQSVREAMIIADWSRTTINTQIGRIVRMYSWGVSQEMVRPGVGQALREVGGLHRGRSQARQTTAVQPVSDAVDHADTLAVRVGSATK